MTGETSLDARFAVAMGQCLGPVFPSRIALAVSGGGDSMAMLTLAHNWTRHWGVELWVVTVDHGLRAGSAEEAAFVARECAALGWPHATLRWHWDGQGNKMDAARRARLELIDRWRGDIRHVLMAHTANDVAETFLMRLARGSGLDGLARMQRNRFVAPLDRAEGEIIGDRPPESAERKPWFRLLRPCLEMGRAEMRHYLRTLKGEWVEDPSNADPTYNRARIRRMLEVLEEAGIDRARLTETACRLEVDRHVARVRAETVWQAIGTARAGTLAFAAEDFCHLTETGTQRRLLGAALRFVSGADYAPRAEALEALRDRVQGGGGGTLHGCEVQYIAGNPTVFREYAAVAGLRAEVGRDTWWDNRWRIEAPGLEGASVRALGEDGWAQLPEGTERALPFRAALSLPSIWDGDRLLACDAMGAGPGATTRLRSGSEERVQFARFLLSH